MKIMAFGKDMSGKLLFPPMNEEAFAASLALALAGNAQSLRRLTQATGEGVAFRGEISRRVIDAGDPLQAGWTFLIAKGDPQRERIVDALRPLAVHRGMRDPGAPLLFEGEAEDEWGNWLQDKLFARQLAGERVPQYILMVGGADVLPFKLQSVLDTVANVGRVDFDSPAHLGQYVDKLIRLEAAQDPVVKREVVLFGPDGGMSDPTYFSREYMIRPLAEHIADDLGFRTKALTAHDATKLKLVHALRGASPALVYTASHGLGMTGEPLDRQKQYNGAICCQASGELTLDDLFSADDVPEGEPFLEGAVFFQFACYGYGTPAQSDYAHWLNGVPQRYAEEDFVAALPKRLLAHPRGPIAYVGHLDTAFLHGFTDQNEPHIAERWHARIQPFVSAVERLLGVQPSGLAMEDMNKRFAVCNALLTGIYDRQQRGSLSWTPQSSARFVDNWITRSDAQNYMVFGDPAARLRIPEA
jgi:hypothetical protein